MVWVRPGLVMLALTALLVGEVWGDRRETAVQPARAVLKAPATATQPAAAALDASDDWAATALERPIFNPDRKPKAEAASTVSPGEAVLPRLAGVLISPTQRRAMFMPVAGRPVTLAEGQQIAGYTVHAISAGRVVLQGPDGSEEVRPSFGASDKGHTDAAIAGITPVVSPNPGAQQPLRRPVIPLNQEAK